MEVILLEKIGKLGNIGDKANVKAGYGRNYLVPQGKAVFATEANVADFELRRADLEAAAAEKLGEAQARAAKLQAMGTVTISAIAGDEGKLFGSVGTHDIAEAVKKFSGVDVPSAIIEIPNAIKEIGLHEVTMKPHEDVEFNVSLDVIPA